MEHPSASDLAAVPLFAGLEPAAVEVLAKRFEVERVEPGRTFIAEGRSGYTFYVLAEGTVSVTVGGDEVRVLGPGDYFGEIAILEDGGRRTASVTATTPVTMWCLFGTSFRVLQTEHPDVAEALELATRARLASDGTWRD